MDTGRSASRAIEIEWLCVDVIENKDIKSLTSENLRTRNSHPKRDRHLWTQKTSKRHTRNFARACYLRLNNLSHVAVARTTCHAGKTARYLTVASLEPQWALTLIKPLRPCFCDSDTRGMSDGKKLSIPLNIRTPATRCGAPSTNLREGLDAPLTCARTQQTPSPHYSRRKGHTRLRTTSPPG